MLSLLYDPTLRSIHDYWEIHSFDYMDLFGKVMPLLFNMLSMFVLSFSYLKTQLPLSLFIVWLCAGKTFTNQHGLRFWRPSNLSWGCQLERFVNFFPGACSLFVPLVSVYGITSSLGLPQWSILFCLLILFCSLWSPGIQGMSFL